MLLSSALSTPGEFHGQRSLADYSPWGCKEPDMMEILTHTQTHTHMHHLDAALNISPMFFLYDYSVGSFLQRSYCEEGCFSL